jgi:hypothetical protein
LVLAIGRGLAHAVVTEVEVTMRGTPDPQMAMLSTLQPGDLIPADHPIRRIRQVVDAVACGDRS